MVTMIELERGIYSATIADRPAVVAFVKRTRKSADDLGQSVTFNPEKIKQARKLAGDKATAYVAAEVWHKSEFVAGYAMPCELWGKHHVGQSDFPFSEKAQAQFTEDSGVIHFRAHIRESEKPKPAPVHVVVKEHKPKPKAAPVNVVVNVKAPESTPKVTTGWTDEEEKEIAGYQETEGITRKSAIQKMRRRKIAEQAKARA